MAAAGWDSQRLMTAAKTTARARPAIIGCDPQTGINETTSSDSEQAAMAAMAATVGRRHITTTESTGPAQPESQAFQRNP
jgi:hypothetical protein